jgi:Putative DNA-binding domain
LRFENCGEDASVTVPAKIKKSKVEKRLSPKAGGAPHAAPTSPEFPTLKEIQSQFQDAILRKDTRVLALLMDNSRTTRKTLFSVYKNGYVGRLVEILGNDYEDLRAYCGKAAFHRMAEAFVAAHPSQTQNARWYGAKMPEFLRADPRYARRPQLADIAAVESVLSNAFDATDAPHVTLQMLAAHRPEEWGRLTFAPHPSVTRLDVSTNAFAIWCAVKNGTAVPRVKKINQTVVAWRQGTMPMIREMPPEEAMLWTEAGRGARFEILCEMAAAFDNPEEAAMRVAGYLQGWISTEMLTSATLVAKAKLGTNSPVRITQ